MQDLFEIQNEEFEDADDNNEDEVENVPGPSTQIRPKKVIRDWISKKNILLLLTLLGKVVYQIHPLKIIHLSNISNYFFSDEIFDPIHVESNKYALQKNGSIPNISYLVIRIYIGILVYTKVVEMPASRVNW